MKAENVLFFEFVFSRRAVPRCTERESNGQTESEREWESGTPREHSCSEGSNKTPAGTHTHTRANTNTGRRAHTHTIRGHPCVTQAVRELVSWVRLRVETGQLVCVGRWERETRFVCIFSVFSTYVASRATCCSNIVAMTVRNKGVFAASNKQYFCVFRKILKFQQTIAEKLHKIFRCSFLHLVYACFY